MTMGTPTYMAPEQIADASTVDHRADLWSLAAILYELHTAERAFRGATVQQVFEQVTRGEYTPVPAYLSAEIRLAIEATLVIDPRERPADAGALGALLGPPLAEPVWPDELLLRTPPSLDAVAPSTETLTFGTGGSDTFDLTPAVERAPATSRRPLLVGAGALVVAVGLIASALALRPSPHAGPMPVLGVPVEAREQLEAGWQQWRAGDFQGAEHTFRDVVARAPDAAAAHFLLGLAHSEQGEVAETIEAFEQADQLVGATPTTRDGELIQAWTRTVYGDGANLLQPLLERRPDDFLVAYGAAGMDAPEAALVSFQRAAALDPDAVPPKLAQVAQLGHLERFGEAREALRPLLAASPRSTVLWLFEAEWASLERDYEGAEGAYRAVIEIDPANAAARLQLAWLLGVRGEMTEYERQRALVFVESTPLDTRLDLARVDSMNELGLGRPRAALARARECGELARERRRWTAALLCRVYEFQTAAAMRDADAMEAALGALTALAASPELPGKFVRGVATRNLVRSAQVAEVRGDRTAVVAVLERVSALDEDGPAREVGFLVGRLDGDMSAERARLAQQGGGMRCMGLLHLARVTERRGGSARADWEAMLDDCAIHTDAQYALAYAHERLATQAAADGDEVGVIAHLDAFDALWHSPEEDQVLVRRVRALRDR
jgi:tetratricopeptide (TPR) repeat protein